MGKQIVGQRRKASLRLKVIFSEELSTTLMGATRSSFPCQGSQNNGASSPVTMPPPKTRCAQAQTNLLPSYVVCVGGKRHKKTGNIPLRDAFPCVGRFLCRVTTRKQISSSTKFLLLFLKWRKLTMKASLLRLFLIGFKPTVMNSITYEAISNWAYSENQLLGNTMGSVTSET